jgi:uncharacterized membrane protein (DUF2068 family)
MASQEFTSSKTLAEQAATVPRKRAPTLYAIIVFKVGKGFLFFLLGVFLYFQADRDLPQEYADLLKKPIFQELRIHPENKLVQHIADKIADLTETKIKLTGIGTALWALFPLTEGIGLIFRASWAGWLAIGESAFFVPIELYELARRFSWFVVAFTIANIIVVWYLYANREQLFHHHPAPRRRHDEGAVKSR